MRNSPPGREIDREKGIKMKFEEINRRFTEVVTAWIAKGYTFNLSTMAGHQGELGKVDLTDGKEVIRILLDHFGSPLNRIGDDYYSLEGIKLIVGRVTDPVTPNSPDEWQTVWNNNLEPISYEEFYLIGTAKYTGARWYGTKEDTINAQKKSHERYKARHVPAKRYFSEEAKDIVLPFLKRQPKSKSLRLSDITNVTKTISMKVESNSACEYARYTVTAKGHEYRLK